MKIAVYENQTHVATIRLLNYGCYLITFYNKRDFTYYCHEVIDGDLKNYIKTTLKKFKEVK